LGGGGAATINESGLALVALDKQSKPDNAAKLAENIAKEANGAA